MTYEMVKKNYNKKLWNKQMVAIAVVKGVITEEQYKEIKGEDYTVRLLFQSLLSRQLLSMRRLSTLL